MPCRVSEWIGFEMVGMITATVLVRVEARLEAS